MLRDERGKWSSGRALLWAWSVASLYYVLRTPAPDALVLSFLSTVELGLIGWVGGARVGQYLFPTLAAMPKLLLDKAKVPERDHAMGIQPTLDDD